MREFFTIGISNSEYKLIKKALEIYDDSLSFDSGAPSTTKHTAEKNAKLEEIWHLLDRLFNAQKAE